MFRITEAPSSESLVQCLAENYKNDSIVSVDMDKVGVMAAHCDLLYVRAVHCIWRRCTGLTDDGSSVIRNVLEHF